MLNHFPNLVGKDNHNSRHGKIERCLQIMKKAGREKFTAEDVEDATGVFHLTVTGILKYTQGIYIERITTRPKVTYWHFDGNPVCVPVSEKKSVDAS